MFRNFSLTPATLLNKCFAVLVISFGLILSGCVSSGTSTSGYTGPTISSVSAKRSSAAKSRKAAQREVRSSRREVKKIERQMSRDERRIKRKRISQKSKDRALARLKKNKSALRTAKRQLRKDERALSRAERAEKRAIRRVETAKRRKAAAERRLAEAKARQAKKQQELAQSEAARPEKPERRSIFALSDPALKNVDDYRARIDGAFPVAAIPIDRMNKRFLRQQVRYSTKHKKGTIIVDPHARFLYLVQSGGKAMRYGIGVGKAGFEWSGRAHIGWKQKWPKWTPPKEMIERRPDLEKWSAENGGMPGGPTNPLGARALYLMQGNVDTLYRLHGTPQWASIGTAASSGCIRLMNQDVIDLYERVPNGAQVIVKS